MSKYIADRNDYSLLCVSLGVFWDYWPYCMSKYIADINSSSLLCVSSYVHDYWLDCLSRYIVDRNNSFLLCVCLRVLSNSICCTAWVSKFLTKNGSSLLCVSSRVLWDDRHDCFSKYIVDRNDSYLLCVSACDSCGFDLCVKDFKNSWHLKGFSPIGLFLCC